MFREKLRAWTRNVIKAEELEARLPLLGPMLESQTYQSFNTYIRSLYKEPVRSKTTEPKPKGKITKAATLKREGTYTLTFLDKKTTFNFKKSKKLKSTSVTLWAKTLTCDESLLRALLLKKNFSLDE